MAKAHDPISRREFTAQSLLAFFAGITITVSGCGDDDPTTPTAGDEMGTISGNHGHAVTVSAADITAGNGVTLDLRGGADHNHQVTLTSAEIVQIRNGARVSTTSTTTNAHQHTVTFN
jgi:hypothetical protein